MSMAEHKNSRLIPGKFDFHSFPSWQGKASGIQSQFLSHIAPGAIEWRKVGI